MADEFFKKGKDESSVLKDFISTLEIDESAETEEQVEKILAPIFIEGFTNGYKAMKTWSFEAKGNPNKMRNLDVWIDDAAGRIPNPGKDQTGAININPYIDQLTPREISKYLGNALGLALGFVEFVIVSNEYKEISKEHQTTQRVLGYYTKIRDKMRAINRPVKQKFIAKRLEKIERIHAKELSREQQILILKIAYIFLS